MNMQVNAKFLLLGRILIGAVFAFMGLYKILNWGMTAGWMGMKGVPMVPIALVVAIIAELGGGLAIMFNIKLRVVAVALALFMIPVNFIMHNFWALPPEMMASEFLSFLQNVMIIGGLFGLAAVTKAQDQSLSSPASR
ncbi:DoxX family protein [Brevibacillus dissolubilis]|uniref:DoxX family protein n=1 Tax=Brevibacillus dissolubilis TaxID=1844116 RepID=UPI0011174267|nr:DoxX family protein [Brevibacillus dissolubilis]